MKKFTQILNIFLILLILILSSCVHKVGIPKVEWNVTFDGSERDESFSVQQTKDRGYIVAGFSSSGAWLIKTYPNGTKQWDKTWNGNGIAYSIQQTSDKADIFAGWSGSESTTSSQDAWLVKTYENGTEQWERTYGGSGFDYFYSVQQTSDKGFIMVGNTNSFGNSYDIWLIKTDYNGTELWNKTFGGLGYDSAYSVQQTNDGGFIIAGNTKSFSNNTDFFLIKTDKNGNMQWNKTFGGSKDDYAYSAQETADKGYAVVGNTRSFSDSLIRVLFVKTDRNGNEKWRKIYGGETMHTSYSFQQTKDKGYVIAGLEGVNKGRAWILKTYVNGSEEWNISIDNDASVDIQSVKRTRDGGYIVAGYLYVPSHENLDVWLIKLKEES